MNMNRFTILSLLFVSIFTVAPTMAVAGDDPEAVIQKYYDARAQGDVDAALAFFADDAVLDAGRCRPCVGKAGVRKMLERAVKHKSTRTPIESYPSGNVVTQRVETRGTSSRKAGLERVICWSIWKVKNGKIAFLRHVHDRTDPQTARFIKWHREQRRARAR